MLWMRRLKAWMSRSEGWRIARNGRVYYYQRYAVIESRGEVTSSVQLSIISR
jgi:hypothetical protein